MFNKHPCSLCGYQDVLHSSYNFSMGPLEVVDKLTDQPKELLRVLIRRFPEFNLQEEENSISVSERRNFSLSVVTLSETFKLVEIFPN